MSDRGVVLLHISDIHLGKNVGTVFDADLDLRRELERDAEYLVRELGVPRVDGLLITGDIAFSGKTEEYAHAATWIETLTDKVGCPKENVWVTPGNHDVDRSKASTLLRTVHNTLKEEPLESLDQKISEHLQDAAAGPLLLGPLSAYNEFAARYGCAVDSSKPHWDDSLPLNDGSQLLLRGMNSVLVSNSHDNDGDNRLILGLFQAQLPAVDGGVHLTLCHHPPSWLRDGFRAESFLNHRATIQLYGHRHEQRIQQIEQSLVLTAGALHPERTGDWEPRYNLLHLRVDVSEGSRWLNAEIWARRWNQNDVRFVPDSDTYGNTVRKYQLKISGDPSATTVNQVESLENQSNPTSEPVHQEAKETTMKPFRKLVYRFYSLPFPRSIEVAQQLSLVEESDREVSGSQLLGRWVERARERSLLDEMWDRIAEAMGEPTIESDRAE